MVFAHVHCSNNQTVALALILSWLLCIGADQSSDASAAARTASPGPTINTSDRGQSLEGEVSEVEYLCICDQIHSRSSPAATALLPTLSSILCWTHNMASRLL